MSLRTLKTIHDLMTDRFKKEHAMDNVTNRVRPIRDFVVIQPEDHADKTTGGIIIPKTIRDKTQRGKVLAVGPGRVTEHGIRVKPEVEVGDVVIYLENTIAQRITPNDRSGAPVILPDVEIIAVVEA